MPSESKSSSFPKQPSLRAFVATWTQEMGLHYGVQEIQAEVSHPFALRFSLEMVLHTRELQNPAKHSLIMNRIECVV